MSRLDASGLFYTDLFGREEGLISLLLVANPYSYETMIDGMDRLVLAVYGQTPERPTEHWMWEETRILVRRVTPECLEKWVTGGESRGVIQWLIHGDILLDKNGYLADLRRQLDEWPPEMKERKVLCEFSKFSKTYLQAKQDLKDGQILDAYSHILTSLHHWAHIALIEEGMHPELTVWVQVRRVNPGIYKLYEELTTNKETVEQRVQLVMLACEFSVLTKMKSSCSLLLRVVGSRAEGWSVSELMVHPELKGLELDLSLLLQKLAKKGYLREIARSRRSDGIGIPELRYAPAPGERVD
ncbi:nucleotidyltransferase-like protein [Cohnella xylanilytica]|uniref:nucleotidyltransferase-like protein n=1 Tax=Cohnella xylanilytica TaxID=557555 RepID=UPI001FE27B90|nr:nucleotidyltransferase-like protein [Cohnella xylanilytica]